eukprot:UN22503
MYFTVITKTVKEPVDMKEKELGLYSDGWRYVVGCDEAGRGPLAGPVVSAACMLPPDVDIEGVCDSKAILTEELREAVYEKITTHPKIKWAYAVLDREEIDNLNILQAAMKGMADSVDQLVDKGMDLEKIFVLIDGPYIPRTLSVPKDHAEAVVKGDSKCACIAAASIIAKVTRDRLMHEYHKQYPQYEWNLNKGYATPRHKELVKQYGPCTLHRRSFNPIKTMLGWTRPVPEKASKV